MAETTKWILVADAARARIFEVDPEGVLVRTPVEDLTHGTKASRDIASDRPGRTFDRAAQGRHAKEPPTDPHRHEKRRFAHELAAYLEEQRTKEAFGQLFIVAPPQMLGDLRDEFSDGVKNRIAAETAKDLSMLAPHEIETRLEEIFGQ